MIKRAQNILFYSLVFLLPLNLGKHFIVSEAYVKSHLIDYLIPTVWVTDLLVLLLVFLWLATGGFKRIASFSGTKILLVFFATLLPSVAIAPRIIPSLYVFFSLVLHILFMIVVATSFDVENEFKRLVTIVSISVVLLSLLAFAQWREQGSVFDNYMFFGEQPYDGATKNIALVSLFGHLKVPVYGTFRHPNIFGGYLAIVLFWIYALLLQGNKQALFKVSFTLGIFAILLTLSEASMLALFLGVVYLMIIKRFGRAGILFSLFVTFMIFFSILFLPLLSKVGWFQEEPSIFRRSNLQKSAYMMLDENALLGVGLGNFTVRVEDYLPRTQVLRFIQPAHNIFVLLFAEAGIFALLAFFVLCLFAVVTLLDQPFGLAAILFVSMLQFFILGSFDHYLFTIQQMQLLFWLTVGLALTYTRGDAEV